MSNALEKMNDWKSLLKADPTDWLLENDNPSVRYFTMTDILDIPVDSHEVMDAIGIIISKAKTNESNRYR